MFRRFTLILFFFSLVFNVNLTAQSPEECDCVHPIIFVHGWKGAEESWEKLSKQLKPIWGDEIKIPNKSSSLYTGTVYYANLNYNYDNAQTNIWGINEDPDYPSYIDDDVVVHEQFTDVPEILPSKCIYAISFDTRKDALESSPNLLIKGDTDFDLNASPSNTSDSNQSSAFKQGYALGKMISKIINITGKEKVILVGHSMGGLAIREYLQRKIGNNHPWWVEPNDLNGHKVAKVLTVGTPHKGANTGNMSTDLGDFLGSVVGFDLNSEAVRDLRYSYEGADETTSGIYLYGGAENDIPTPNSLGVEVYWNRDVNCNGTSLESIEGINNIENFNIPWDGSGINPNMPLPLNIKYFYYVSDISHPYGNSLDNPLYYVLRNSDGIVYANRQWLYEDGDGSTVSALLGVSQPLPSAQFRYFLSDRITSNKKAYHVSKLKLFSLLTSTNETSDYDNVIRGLDEADYPYFAGKVDLDKWYAGIAQKRADIVPFSSEPLGTANNLIDSDWYKIVIPSDDNSLKINLKKPFIQDIITRIDFYTNSPDDNSNISSELFASSPIGGDQDLEINTTPLSAGTYYFRVTNWLTNLANPDAAWQRPYKFKIEQIGTACAENDSYEPNDNFSSAHATAFPELTPVFSELEGIIGSPDDKDIYKISPGFGELRIALRSFNQNYDLFLYNSNGDIIQSSTREGTNNEGIIEFISSGTHFIGVESAEGGFDCNDTYLLSARWIGPMVSNCNIDEYEPNDAADRANETVFSQVLGDNDYSQSTDANLLKNDNYTDEDWYRLQINSNGQLNVDLNNVPLGYSYRMALYNASNDLLESGNNIAPLIYNINGNSSLSNFYLKVFSNGEVDCNEFYELALNWQVQNGNNCNNDTYEPNNTQSSPNTTAFSTTLSQNPYNETKESYLPSTADQDFYQIRLNQPGLLEIRLWNPQDLTLNYGIDLYQSSGSADYSNQGVLKTIKYEYNSNQTEELVVGIYGEDGSERSCTKPYELQVVWTPGAGGNSDFCDRAIPLNGPPNNLSLNGGSIEENNLGNTSLIDQYSSNCTNGNYFPGPERIYSYTHFYDQSQYDLYDATVLLNNYGGYHPYYVMVFDECNPEACIIFDNFEDEADLNGAVAPYHLEFSAEFEHTYYIVVEYNHLNAAEDDLGYSLEVTPGGGVVNVGFDCFLYFEPTEITCNGDNTFNATYEVSPSDVDIDWPNIEVINQNNGILKLKNLLSS